MMSSKTYCSRRYVSVCNQRGFVLLPVIVVAVALALLIGGGITIYRIDKQNKTDNDQLRQEVAELKKATPTPSQKATETPEPKSTPKPLSIPKTITTIKPLETKVSATPASVSTKQPTPIPVKATPVPTQQSAAVSIELCKATAKKAVNDAKDQALQSSPGVPTLAKAVSLGDAEQIALKYGYLSQANYNLYQEFMLSESHSLSEKQTMSSAYWMDVANLQKWAVNKLAEVDSVITKEENDMYQKCLSSL